MRFNQTTLLNIALIVIFGLALTQAEAYMGDYQIYILKLIFINAILALSLNLIYGFTGLFSLGHAGFMAIGAYVGALCTLLPEQKEIMWILDPIIWPFSVLHTPFWVAVIAGGLVAMIFAFIIAVPVLRLGDDYLGIATLGFAEIIRVVIVNATSITNGSLGIKGIPGEATLLTCYIWTVITLVVLSRLIFSNFGNVLRCIRDNEIAARSVGIPITKYKLMAFVTSAVFAGVAGVLYALNYSSLVAKKFDYNTSILILVFVVLGGIGNLRGSVIAAAVLTVLPELLRSMNDYRMLIYAIVLIVVMIFNQSPEMIALRKRLTARFRKEDAEGKGAKDKEKKGVA